MPKKPSPRRAAFTLTEIAIVLSIVGLLISSIWTAVGLIYSTKKITDTSTEIFKIFNATKGFAAQNTGQFSGGYANIGPSLIDLGIVPSIYIVPCAGTGFTFFGPTFGGSAGCATDAWQTHQLIFITDSVGFGTIVGVPGDFEVGFSNLFNSDCKRLLPRLIEDGKGFGLINVYADSAGGMAITPTTTYTASSAFFGACTGNAILQYML